MMSVNTSRLERLSSLQIPAMILATLCGGLVFAGISASDEVAQTPVLAFLVSPVFIAVALLAAVGFATLFIAGAQVDGRLFRIASDLRRDEREDLMCALGGERFAHRWRSNPRVRNRVEQVAPRPQHPAWGARRRPRD